MPIDYEAHFDSLAISEADHAGQAGFRRQRLNLFQHHIPPGLRVLEWGCGQGEILAGLQPGEGVGIDISGAVVDLARAQHSSPTLAFCKADLHDGSPTEMFDALVLDDLCRYLRDVQACLENLRASAAPASRLYITSMNYVWRPTRWLSQWLRLTPRGPECNWLSSADLANLLELAGWEVITRSSEIMFPIGVPLLSTFFNRFLVRLPLFRHLGSLLFLVARPAETPHPENELTVSVVIPARNEAGHIRAAIERIPPLGKSTEILFIEGGSADNTWEVIENEIHHYHGAYQLKAIKQPGTGKWDAVRAGFEAATGDIVVIQDADLTAAPEDLVKFYSALVSRRAEFANGSRLVYPLEKQSMRFLNVLGNKFFATALTFIIGQPVKDSLCGTKMLWRRDYQRILGRIRDFENSDPFGDFNLLFGAALLDLRIRDIPVRYRERAYGETNIRRFRHGLVLLRMTWLGLRRVRFH